MPFKIIRNRKIRLLLLAQCILLLFSSFLGIYPIIVIREVVDMAFYGNEAAVKRILMLGCLYLILQLLHVLTATLIRFLSSYMQSEITYDLQKKIFKHINRVKLQKINFSDTGDLSNTLIQDTQYLSENIIEPFINVVSAALTFAWGIFYTSQINVYLIWIILPLGLVSSLMIKSISSRSYENISLQRKLTNTLWKSFNEGIMGFVPLKFHDCADHYFTKVDTQGQRLRNVSVRQGKIESASHGVTSAIFMTTIGLIMILSALFVIRGNMTLGGLTAIMMYNHMLSDPLIQIQEASHRIQKLKVSFGRVADIMKLETDDRSGKYSSVDEIELKDVEFHIEDHTIIQDMNIHMHKGDSLMIAGSTGSGKTTLANIVSGIYDSTGGSVIFRYNGKPVDNKPRISYMLQNEYVFDDTVANNIRIGNIDLEDDVLREIIEICELEDVLENHKGPVGENGNLLSGGEKKRLLIARTLADRSSDIFIFDEMSASLDEKTFLRIWKKADQYLAGKFRIYIEHNLNIQEDVDRVLVLGKRLTVENS